MSASPVGTGFMLERTEVHKSCKSLEVLLNILNDYCEAMGAVVTLEKRLAKALKDMASLKATFEVPSNTFAASAAIFEALSEVDSKFAKLTDREYENAASDVKKWFKKLTKEEKLHDERIDSANARIKQAAQIYDRKAKKSPRDSVEEHTRYINLISSLGPELSQEKYNHALSVTQRHTATTYTVAACVSRIADAEWLRACENVRKFSPAVGHLGEWKALCEGGWVGSIPRDLPQEGSMPLQNDQMIPTTRAEEEGQGLISRNDAPRLGQNDENRNGFHPTTPTAVVDTMPYSPPKPLFQDDNAGSLRSLSAFPAPPTHIPPSPLKKSHHDPPVLNSPTTQISSSPFADQSRQDEARFGGSQQPSSHSDDPTTLASSKETSFEVDAGVPPGDEANAERQDTPKDRSKEQEHARVGTNLSSESRVAAIRNRFTEIEAPVRPLSPGLKDVPSLPLSVSGLASRYNTGDPSPSPPLRTSSPSVTRRQALPPLDTLTQTARLAEKMFGEPPITRVAEQPVPRESKVADAELKAREKRLHDMEREIRQRELELVQKEERQRQVSSQQQATGRPVPTSYYSHDRSPHSPRHSPSQTRLGIPVSPSQSRDSELPRSPDFSPGNSSKPHSASEHAAFCGCDKCSVSKYKTTNMAPSPHDLRPPEKPFTLRPEKSKGWIRRLSMPVGHAFSLDSSKKSPSGSFAVSKTGGIGFSVDSKRNASVTQFPYMNEDGQLNHSLAGRRSYDIRGLGSKNSSMTNLATTRR